MLPSFSSHKSSHSTEVLQRRNSQALADLQSIKDSCKSDITFSPQLSDITTATRQRTPDYSQRSALEIRTRDSTPLSPRGKSYQGTPIRKRQYVDLTVDDDDNDLSTTIRKKSRSSSQSTEASNDCKASGPGQIKTPGFRPASLKPRKSAEKQLSTHSSRSLPSSGKHVSAVLVPPPQPSPAECRRQFLENLQALGRGVSLFNNVDTTSPPTSFKFVQECILGSRVTKATEDFMSGCKCRKDNGRQIGCEYLSCECLDDSALNEDGKRVFPYAASQAQFGCLRDFYLETRHHIYECNSLCNCESNCKNRVVQHGRTVLLQIFKTTNRGWGLRCMQDLKKGQFIDTYRGEIITDEEANRRSKTRTVDQDIYLMDLDKWTEEEGAAQYVCDGMHIGGPTRFINHSCDPNCGIYTVSYNHADSSIYDLAFFATEAIPKGAELTFDYISEEDQSIITEQRANELEREKGYRPAKCLCGTAACRGYFFQ